MNVALLEVCLSLAATLAIAAPLSSCCFPVLFVSVSLPVYLAGCVAALVSHCATTLLSCFVAVSFAHSCLRTGSTPCRCFLCYLPAPLFPYLPFEGYERSLTNAKLAHAEQALAEEQWEAWAQARGLRQGDILPFQTLVRQIGGNCSRVPLLATGTLDLGRISVVLPVMHNIKEVCAKVLEYMKHYCHDKALLATNQSAIIGPSGPQSAEDHRLLVAHWEALVAAGPGGIELLPSVHAVVPRLMLGAVSYAVPGVCSNWCGHCSMCHTYLSIVCLP